jgi:hypothetical protein
MMARAAGTGMVSAAFILSVGCGGQEQAQAEEKGSELRRASFRSFAAADRVARCGGAGRPEAAHEVQRFETLKDFARRRSAGAEQVLWRGENDWSAVAERGAAPPCAGEAGYRQAVREFSASLDGLVAGIMSYED